MDSPVRILVLDDNVDVAAGIAEILELNGYDVKVVHDAKSAVSVYKSDDIDMGIFDVRMPGMNGVEAFIEILQHKPNAQVVLMTGYADDETIQVGLNNGAKGLLSKPFEPEDLLSRLEAAT